MPELDAYLRLARESDASDVHLGSGKPPLVRIDGELRPLDRPPLSDDEAWTLVDAVLDDRRRAELDRQGSTDLSHSVPGAGRFRINVCRYHHGVLAVCRVVPEDVPALDSLGLPSVVPGLCEVGSGLILVTGTGSTGKSTTLAGLIDHLNQTRSLNILTLEDPIEFVHRAKKSLIVQREVGEHVRSFHEGLRSALREDPDVILVGELRDPETISLALEATETGHLVLSTLHTRGAYQTIHRILDVFPAEAQAQVRHTLAENLRCVVSQELVRAADGRGRRVAAEILVMTPAIAQLIREGKTFQIPQALITGRRFGMQHMDQALLALVGSGDIDPNEAFLRATDRREFMRFVTDPELKRAHGPAPTVRAGVRDAA